MSNPDAFMALAKKWDAIAEKMERGGVGPMTANTHRLFANELKAVCAANAAAVLAWDGMMIRGDEESVRHVRDLVLFASGA